MNEEVKKEEGLGKEIVRNLFDKHLNAVLFTAITIVYLLRHD